MLTEIPQKSPKYFCSCCIIGTDNKKDFNKHLLTAKHKKNESLTDLGQNLTNFIPISQPHNCKKCNKVYKSRVGVWYHEKKCVSIIPNSSESHIFASQEMKMLTSVITDLVKSNSELQKSVLEVCKNGTNITNNNNMLNSNNKTFNLNVFLNETCKDAMNIMEFVDSLKLQVSDLENMGKVGFISGISNIIVKNLKAMDIHKRPVHCSDSKREVMYVKDENKWEKENDEKKKLKKAIKYIAHKNSKMLPEFKAKYPDCIYSDSKKSDQYNKIIIEAMGGHGNNDSEKEDKIIHNIAKEVIINKTVGDT